MDYEKTTIIMKQQQENVYSNYDRIMVDVLDVKRAEPLTFLINLNETSTGMATGGWIPLIFGTFPRHDLNIYLLLGQRMRTYSCS